MTRMPQVFSAFCYYSSVQSFLADRDEKRRTAFLGSPSKVDCRSLFICESYTASYKSFHQLHIS